MKARIAFYFAAVVALVLFLAAAVPSHATQHRDPALTQSEMVQRPQPTLPAHAPEPIGPKPRETTGNTHTQAKAKKAARKPSPSPPKSSGDSQGRTATSMGTK